MAGSLQDKLKNTKTMKNLEEAYSGESMAMSRYAMFAQIAREEGYEQMAEIFEETMINEREHAKLHFKNMGNLGTTAENLQFCINGEHYEHTEMYPRMAKEAREEGFENLARTFEGIAEVEKRHEARYQKLLDNIENGSVFKKSADEYEKISSNGKVMWKCRNCGYIHEGEEAPLVCKVCKKPRAYFELFKETY